MPPEIPTATYRLQFHKDFGFDAAARIVPYLKALGISHLYASPFLKARAGSTHGYDIVDHRQINPELGGAEAFDRLATALKDAGIGLILDFVPNHMGVGYADNPWWLDVLEWGQKSPRASSFDIDWETLHHWHGPGVLLPVLGQPYGDAIESGEIVLKYDAQEGSFSAWYFEHRLPINPSRYGDILQTVVNAAGAADQPAGKELLRLAAEHRGPSSPSYVEAPAYKSALARVAGGAETIERGLAAYRASKDDSSSSHTLNRLLERQAYRLAQWRLAVTEINYRRFFDVNTLAGIRVEERATFDAVHELVAALIAQGRLQGLRLDHIDGLSDPLQYARRLQRLIRRSQGRSPRPFYVLVEKILADGEPMPRLPGVHGTTGYEWLNVISRVLVDDRGLKPLEQLRREVTDSDRDFDEIRERAKIRVLENILASEFTVLTRLLDRIAAGHYRTRDFGFDRLRAALREYILHFPIYRTYITAAGPSAEDRAIIERTIAAARARWFGSDHAIFDFLRDALTLDLVAPGRVGYSKARVIRFALKVQQFTGPMMAKSLEDTAFYRYHRLLALNEVGGEPDASGLPIADFHHRMITRAATFPYGMTATATHDTKRGEDTRARILAISELTDEWAEAVAGWRRLNERLAEHTGNVRRPTSGHEYMLYQILLGVWPLHGIDATFVPRIEAYAIKAAREGKVETSWMNPDEAYENAMTAFIRRLLDAGESGEFIRTMDAFARRTALLGALNGLSQLGLKATIPGVPDFYQGTELWDLSLVDPDNRRPVDFDARIAALAELESGADWPRLAAGWEDGRIKLALSKALLGLRNRLPTVFRDGVYRPIEVHGPHQDHVLAFARTGSDAAAIIVVGRHFGAMTDGGRRWPTGRDWNASVKLDAFESIQDVMLPGRTLASGDVPIAPLFETLPVALLQAVPRRHRP